MAKRATKAKPFIPETIRDEDGYLTDGMFRWDGPTIPYSAEMLKKWAEDFNTEYHQTATQRIASLRRHLTQFIQPFVDGPYTPEQALKIQNRTMTRINIASGDGVYAYHKGVPNKGYWEDAMNAVRELDELARQLAAEPQNIDLIVRSAIHIGAMSMQAQLRAIYAPEVLSATKRRKASAKGGKKSARFTDDVRKIAEPIFKKFKRSKLSDEYAAKRTAAELKADHAIDISPKTIKRRLVSKVGQQ